tara:strand:+ start:220 stop:381 length:162 start_codon:yes stop_codon:yes gene_type:complete
MDAFTIFSAIVLLFVAYHFLKMIYNFADRKYREGFNKLYTNPKASQYGGYNYN